MSDLETLVNEYNDAERLQAARLKAIFDMVAALPGYHRVAFSDSTVWSGSLLHHEDRSVVNQNLADMVQLITAWQ
jgi:hypothetical protein